MGRMLSMTIPCILYNVVIGMIAAYGVDSDNPRFLGYVLIPLGMPSYPMRMLLELIVHLQMYYMVVIYWILFFAVFSSVSSYWIRVIIR